MADSPVIPTGEFFWTSSGNDIYNANSGKVGVNAQAPTATFEVACNTGATGQAVRMLSDGNAGSWSRFDMLDGDGNSALFYLAGGGMRYRAEAVAGFHAFLSSGGTERMRITADGKVGIGTGAPDEALHVVGNIVATGDITAAYSDDRLKDRIGTLDDALAKVCCLEGFTYRPNEKAIELGAEDKERVGLSAQDLESILPQAVVESAMDGYKTIQYEKVVPLLVEAIKELARRLD